MKPHFMTASELRPPQNKGHDPAVPSRKRSFKFQIASEITP